MKNAVKVVIFTVCFVAVCAGAVFGLYKYNKSDFLYTTGALKDTVEITGYKGDSVNIKIPEKIKGKKVAFIGETAFSNTEIESVEIGDNVLKIGAEAFRSCSKLEKVTFGKSAERIEEYAFDGCSGLKEVYLTSSVSFIGEGAFRECPLLKEITTQEGGHFLNEGGVLYNSDKTAMCWIPMSFDFSSYKVPETVTEFYDFLLYKHSEVKSFTFPKGTQKIPRDMFLLCSGLESVAIPDTVTSIGNSTFMGCTSLDELYVPESVTKIDNYAFPYPLSQEEDKDSDKKDDEKAKKQEEELKKYFNLEFKLVVKKDSAAHKYAQKYSIPCQIQE